MPAELRDALHRAAALPRHPLDLAHLLARSRRRRRRRIGAVAGSLLLAATVAVVAVPRAGLDPRPLPTAPAASPVPFASLPPGWTVLPAPPEVRHRAATAWTGEQLLIWGGTAPAYTDAPEDTGFGFDTRTGTWHELPRSPLSARTRPASAACASSPAIRCCARREDRAALRSAHRSGGSPPLRRFPRAPRGSRHCRDRSAARRARST